MSQPAQESAADVVDRVFALCHYCCDPAAGDPAPMVECSGCHDAFPMCDACREKHKGLCDCCEYAMVRGAPHSATDE